MASTENYGIQKANQQKAFHGLNDLNQAMNQLDSLLKNLSGNISEVREYAENELASLSSRIDTNYDYSEEQLEGLSERITSLTSYIDGIKDNQIAELSQRITNLTSYVENIASSGGGSGTGSGGFTSSDIVISLSNEKEVNILN